LTTDGDFVAKDNKDKDVYKFVDTYSHAPEWKVATRGDKADEAKFNKIYADFSAGAEGVIVHRTCNDCEDSHREVFYKRLTDPSALTNPWVTFMSDWNSQNNQFNEDFKLYSSLQDALTDSNAWAACDFQKTNVGFPGHCQISADPQAKVLYQYNGG
jgi:hypothetical protein